MKMPKALPNAERAWISPLKLNGYLLSAEHPEGSSKAKFLGRFGFDARRPDLLERALLQSANEGEVVSETATEHGVKYEVLAALAAPDGRHPRVVTIWIIEGDVPRFVSLNPSKRRIADDS